MQKQGKVWGMTSELFSGNNVEVHRIEGRKGGYSSTHKHLHKANLFFCESGRILIKVHKSDYDLVDETTLGPMDHTIVGPGEFHSFIVLEDCVVYEIYWVEIDGKDIERRGHGGTDKS